MMGAMRATNKGSVRAEREPLFVLAPPRSFTSLISTMLGQHPRMYGFPELNLFMAETMDEFWRGTDGDGERKSTFWPVMRHGLLRTVAQLYAGEQTIEPASKPSTAWRWPTAGFERAPSGRRARCFGSCWTGPVP